jgi:Ca2+/Na+ antiporter
LKPVNPGGRDVYALLVASSSLLLLFGFHRAFFATLQDLSLPSLVISALTGIANLSWYELAYVLGGALKNVTVFTLLPFLGSATGLVSVLLQFTPVRWRREALLLHIAFALMVALVCLMILLLRFWRGFADPWRIVTTITFLLTYGWWIFYFRRTRHRTRKA